MIQKKIIIGLFLASSAEMFADMVMQDQAAVNRAQETEHVKQVQAQTALPEKKKVKKEQKASKKKVESSTEKKVSNKKVKKDTDKSVTPQDVITVVEEPRVLNNRIVVRIPSIGIDGAKDMIITERMLHTKSLEGRVRSKDEIIFEYCVYDKAVNGYHMTPARQEAEQHIEGLKSQYGLGQKEIEKLFREGGMTFEEGVEQLVMFYTNRAFLSNLVSSKVLVTEKEIEKYYKDHPEVVPTSYKIEKAFIEKDAVSPEAIENLRKYGLGQDNVMWQPAYWITEEDLVESKKFITTMHEGVVKVLDADDNWEVIRLRKKVEEHTKPLVERYKEITEKLQHEKFQEKLESFKKDLLKEYSIIEVA